MQPVMAGAAVACFGGKGMAGCVASLLPQAGLSWLPQERHRQLPRPVLSGWSVQCAQSHHPTACANCEFYLSFGTLLPYIVLLVSKFKHCNVCCSWCSLDVWTQVDADACENWWMFCSGLSGHRVRGSQDMGWHGSAAWRWQKGICPCWAVVPQDKTSLSLREALSKMLLQGFRRWKELWKGWSNFY